MKYGVLFLTLAILSVTFALRDDVWFLLWPAVSFAVVGISYLLQSTWAMGKCRAGTRSWIAIVVLLPYLVYLYTVWHVIRLLSREPALNQLGEDVFLARRLLENELPPEVVSVVDLTSEFVEPRQIRSRDNYLCWPLLDGMPPRPEELAGVVDAISAMPKPVLIHCAQGHGRTGTVAVALLLKNGNASSVSQAVDQIQAVRPGVDLNSSQRAALSNWFE